MKAFNNNASFIGIICLAKPMITTACAKSLIQILKSLFLLTFHVNTFLIEDSVDSALMSLQNTVVRFPNYTVFSKHPVT